jgi:hypothetical protein
VKSPANVDPNRSDDGFTSPPIRLDAGARVTRRSTCWRAACRDRFGDYASVAQLTNGTVVAWCHRRIHDDFSLRADRWRHEAA